MDKPDLPTALAAIREEFLSLELADRMQLLLEFSDRLPEISEGKVSSDSWERVDECQAPVYIHVENLKSGITVSAKAPKEAPTTRGFASILVEGLTGASPEEVLSVPADFPHQLGLQDGVSSLRLRGMGGMLWRIKNHLEN